MNATLLNFLIVRYNALSFTDNYIFGFKYKKNVYMTFTTHEILPFITTIDKASNNNGYSLRYRPTNQQKLLLLENSILVCSVNYLNDMKKNSCYNYGETFEKIIYEKFNQKWKKDNIPFTKAGDIIINEISYQIKFERATFVSEGTLTRLEK